MLRAGKLKSGESLKNGALCRAMQSAVSCGGDVQISAFVKRKRGKKEKYIFCAGLEICVQRVYTKQAQPKMLCLDAEWIHNMLIDAQTLQNKKEWLAV